MPVTGQPHHAQHAAYAHGPAVLAIGVWYVVQARSVPAFQQIEPIRRARALRLCGRTAGALATLAHLGSFRRLWGGLCGLVLVYGGLHNRTHRIQPRSAAQVLVQVVKVAATFGQVFRKHRQATHHTCRRCGFVAAGVVATVCQGLRIIIATHHQQGRWVLIAQGLGHVAQVASIKSHRHRVPRGFVQARRCGVALCNQHHRRARRIVCNGTAQVPKIALAPTLHKKFVRAAIWLGRRYALHIPQRPCGITHRHIQPAASPKAHTIGLHALAREVRAFTRGAGTVPQLCGFKRSRGVGRVLLGLLCRLLGLALCRKLSDYGGVWWGPCMVALGQHKAPLFGHGQQRANSHPATGLDAFPSGCNRMGVEAIGCGAPVGKQRAARIV